MEFHNTEPFFPERVDLAGALVSMVVRNVNRSKGSKAASIEDFMIVASTLKKSDEQILSPEEREANHLRSTMLLLGGKV